MRAFDLRWLVARSLSRATAKASTGRGALGSDVDRVQRLAAGHEQPVALRPTEAHVAAHFGQADATDQLALRIPHRHAAITDAPARVAGTPQIAFHVAP